MTSKGTPPLSNKRNIIHYLHQLWLWENVLPIFQNYLKLIKSHQHSVTGKQCNINNLSCSSIIRDFFSQAVPISYSVMES